MAFFTVSTKEENIKDFTGDRSKYINSSGIYEVVLKAVIVDSSPGGFEYLNLFIDHKGQEQPLFQAIGMTNKDGTANVSQQLFNKLTIIAGATEGHAISDPVSRMVPIGKGGTDMECMVLEDFTDMPVYIRIQMQYEMYEGKIQQKKIVRNFFRFEDKATASEIVNDAEFGKQFAIEEEFAEKVSYKDSLTKEDVDEWLKSRKSGKTESETTANKPSGGFGGKRFGKK